MAASSDIRKILARLQRDVSALGKAMAQEELDFNESARLLAALDRTGGPGRREGLTQQLTTLRDLARSRCAQEFPRADKQALVIGAGTLERSNLGAKRVWEGAHLARTLASRVADEGYDRETGETLPLGVVCDRVAEVLINCAGLDTASQTWRKGEVERYGLVPRDFYEDSGGRPSVHFVD